MSTHATIAAVVFWGALALIVYTYALFPVLLACFARLFGRSRSAGPAPLDSDLPRVAMVVAAYNEAAVMAAKLANTWAIDYPADRFELYVGSDGSDDGTNRILKKCRDPRLSPFFFFRRRGKISVLNDLMRMVDADIVIMSDASTLFSTGAIRKLVRHFQDPRVGCVTGELRLDREDGLTGEGLYLRYERWIKRQEGRLGCVVGCVGAIFAIRRALYRPLPPDTLVEDFVISMAVLEQGSLVRSEPEAMAVDPSCSSSRDEMTRKTRIGAGDYQALGLTRRLLHPRYGFVCFAYWGHKVLRWMVPFLLLAALAANLSLLHVGFYRLLWGIQVAGLGIAFLAYRMPPGRNLPRLFRPVSYFYLMNYALFQGFLRFLFHTQRVTWERAR